MAVFSINTINPTECLDTFYFLSILQLKNIKKFKFLSSNRNSR
ncbi:Uncharacterized protein dnl_37640 [Desulfonema limicola]|uniref:Uncharacterized protein n=1 Tax=Desulfonema limicola TaxID=45656 RepID=A0A975BA02_9BACT|nr:Uncharacterized protein dnl_37640 [Desulfonema limicola]